jgi:flagellar biosynthesis protein FlhF
MSEAVEQVRNTLGSDAVIIDTLRGTDHIGRFVEITATGELKSPVQHTVPDQQSRPQARTQRSQQFTGTAQRPLAPPRSQAQNRPQRRVSAYGGEIPAPSRMRNPGRPPQRRPAFSNQAPSPPTSGGRRPISRSNQPLHHVKGAERFEHPNTFSSQRDVIIPQSPPSSIQQLNLLNQNHAQANYPSVPQQHPRPVHRGPAAWSKPPESPPAPLTSPLGRRKAPAVGSSSTVNPLVESVQAVQNALNPQGTDAVNFVTDRLNEIVSYIQTGQQTGGVPAPVFEHLKQFFRQLKATGIEHKYAEALIEETKSRIRLNQLDKQSILAHLGQVLAQNIQCIDPLTNFEGDKNVLAFVGPTGVGKTTTIAKIAAHAHLSHEIPVTLISTDTFRMAAVEQLSRYAEILDCPSEAARDPKDLWKMIDEAKTPLVLVDTTGRNPKTPGQLKILSEFFGQGWKGRTVLTVAANTREQDIKPIAEGFAALKYDMVSITKLDETYALGTIYNVSKYTGCPVAWTTNGQRVPEDIELANAESLAVKIIMEAISHKV